MKNFNEIKIGDKAQHKRKITKEDIKKYAELTGDKNPLHIDEDYARSSYFKEIICHGTFLDGIVSTALAQKLPGPGTVLLSLSIKYIAPIKVNDVITIELEVIEKNSAKRTIKISVKATNQNNETIAVGDTKIMMMPDLEMLKSSKS